MVSSKPLSLEDILAALDLEERTVEVPEWGGSVRVRGLTKREQQQLRRAATDAATGQLDADRMEVLMLAHCLVEPAITATQAEQLAGKSAAAFDRVLLAVLDVSGLSGQAQTAAGQFFRQGPAGSTASSDGGRAGL